MLDVRHLNLARLPLPLTGPLDAILCRNVMSYFDRELRSRLVLEFARLLKPGGCLLISHSETLIGIDNELVMVRPSLYYKPGHGTAVTGAAVSVEVAGGRLPVLFSGVEKLGALVARRAQA